MSISGHSHSAWIKFSIIGSMYMGQTFATAFVSQLLPGIYRHQGLPLEKFWILSLGLVPFMFRWLWAPVVDRRVGGRFGRRKSWIIPCTLAGALSYVLLSFVEPTIEAVWWIAGLFAIQALAISTQEIAVDAYMVENLQPTERGVGSGVKLYMESIAELIALAGLAAIYDRYGWDATLAAAAVLFVIFFLPGLIRREPEIHPVATSVVRPSVRRFLARRDSWYIVVLLLTGGISFGMFFPMTSAFLIDEGFSVTQVGLILGIIVVLGMFMGIYGAVFALNLIGLKSTLRVIAISALPSFLPAIWLAQPGRTSTFFTILCLAVPTAIIALLYVVFVVARLGWTSQLQAGTDYSIQSAIFRGASMAAIGVGGFLAAWLNWRGFFVAYPLMIIVVSVGFYLVSDHLSDLVERRHAAERESTLAAQNAG